MGFTNTPSDLLPGTLELLVLKALQNGAKHGYGIVGHIHARSGEILEVGESALYPALQRILRPKRSGARRKPTGARGTTRSRLPAGSSSRLNGMSSSG
jgi:hypothetical protein